MQTHTMCRGGAEMGKRGGCALKHTQGEMGGRGRCERVRGEYEREIKNNGDWEIESEGVEVLFLYG